MYDKETGLDAGRRAAEGGGVRGKGIQEGMKNSC
jgi:hypothetical protein